MAEAESERRSPALLRGPRAQAPICAGLHDCKKGPEAAPCRLGALHRPRAGAVAAGGRAPQRLSSSVHKRHAAK